jgi:hypothetical protein
MPIVYILGGFLDENERLNVATTYLLPKATDKNTSSSAQIILLSASYQNTLSAKDLVNMVKKHSSPFDGPDYFDSSIHDVHEHCDYEQDHNDMKQPLLPHDRTNRAPGKRAYLIGLLHSGSKKGHKKSRSNETARSEKEPKHRSTHGLLPVSRRTFIGNMTDSTAPYLIPSLNFSFTSEEEGILKFWSSLLMQSEDELLTLSITPLNTRS